MQNLLRVLLKSDAALITQNVPTRRVLEIEITAPPPSSNGTGKRPALSLGLVLDCSNSMKAKNLIKQKKRLNRLLR